MKNLKKLLAATVAGALALTMLVGCGKSVFDTKEMVDIVNDTIKTVLGGSFEIETEDVKLSVKEFTSTKELDADAKTIAEEVAKGVGEEGDVADYFNENCATLIEKIFENKTDAAKGYYEGCAISFAKNVSYKSDLYNSNKTVLQMKQLLENATSETSSYAAVTTIDAEGAAGFYETEINGETYLFAVLTGSAQVTAPTTGD